MPAFAFLNIEDEDTLTNELRVGFVVDLYLYCTNVPKQRKRTK